MTKNTQETTTQQPDKNKKQILDDLGVEPTVYHSELVDRLESVEDLKRLAWTSHIRILFYSEQRDMLLHYIEGDLLRYDNPSDEVIREQITEYPKMEVAREQFDPRF